MPSLPVLLALLLSVALPARAAPLPSSGAVGRPASAGQTVIVDPTFGQTGAVPGGRPAGPTGPADPLDRSAGHAMWDPLGGGCVDGGGLDDPFPAGKGDGRAPPFCLPRPCARQLAPDELAFQVLGRPLREGEWETYSTRYAEACRHEAVWPEEAPAPALVASSTDVGLDVDEILDGGTSVWSSPTGIGEPAPRGTSGPGVPDGGGPGGGSDGSPLQEWRSGRSFVPQPHDGAGPPPLPAGPPDEKRPFPQQPGPPDEPGPSPVPIGPMGPAFGGLLAFLWAIRRRT